MSLIVICKIGADESPGLGFIPTLQLEEHELPNTTITPFHFSQESAKATHAEALEVAEIEAVQILSNRYPEGTRYKIEKESAS